MDTTPIVNGLRKFKEEKLSPRLDLDRLVVLKSDRDRLAAIGVMQRSRTVVARSLRNAQPNRKAGLQFAHPGLHVMAVNFLPDIRGPVLVKLVRIFKE